MKTRICDFCSKNISDFSLKVKDEYSNFIWSRYDICPECYNSMLVWIHKRNDQQTLGHSSSIRLDK